LFGYGTTHWPVRAKPFKFEELLSALRSVMVMAIAG
jgi:hypothetical protein